MVVRKTFDDYIQVLAESLEESIIFCRRKMGYQVGIENSISRRKYVSAIKGIKYGIYDLIDSVKEVHEQSRENALPDDQGAFRHLSARIEAYDPRQSKALETEATEESYVRLEQIRNLLLEHLERQQVPTADDIIRLI